MTPRVCVGLMTRLHPAFLKANGPEGLDRISKFLFNLLWLKLCSHKEKNHVCEYAYIAPQED